MGASRIYLLIQLITVTNWSTLCHDCSSIGYKIRILQPWWQFKPSYIWKQIKFCVAVICTRRVCASNLFIWFTIQNKCFVRCRLLSWARISLAPVISRFIYTKGEIETLVALGLKNYKYSITWKHQLILENISWETQTTQIRFEVQFQSIYVFGRFSSKGIQGCSGKIAVPCISELLNLASELKLWCGTAAVGPPSYYNT